MTSDSPSVSKPWMSVSDGGIFDTGGQADTSDVNDWQSMDWKAIKTAVYGDAAVSSDPGSAAAAAAEGCVTVSPTRASAMDLRLVTT